MSTTITKPEPSPAAQEVERPRFSAWCIALPALMLLVGGVVACLLTDYAIAQVAAFTGGLFALTFGLEGIRESGNAPGAPSWQRALSRVAYYLADRDPPTASRS